METNDLERQAELFEKALSDQLRSQGSYSPAFLSALDAFLSKGVPSLAPLLVIKHALQHLATDLIPPLIAFCDQWEVLSDEVFSTELHKVLGQLQEAVSYYSSFLRNLCTQLQQTLPPDNQDATFLATLDDGFRRKVAVKIVAMKFPSKLHCAIHRFFVLALQNLSAAMDSLAEENNSMETDADGPSIEQLSAVPGLEGWIVGVTNIASWLRVLHLDATTDEAASAAVFKHLRERLKSSTERVFDESVLGSALMYSTVIPLRFVRLILPPEESDVYNASSLEQWRAQLSYYVYETVGSLRIKEMFDIVVDYPDSMPAIDDLQECLQNTSLHRQFVSVFGAAIRERLLHPGASTSDIIQQYISTIKALQHVDPSGVVLDAVSGPIREYLRARKDTTRCIVTMLTDDTEGDSAMSLFTELGGGGTEAEDLDFDGPDADKKALEEAESWEPEPMEARYLQRDGTQAAAADVITLLVGIYGSKELFINEYRAMLADRLLAKSDYECDRELRTLELLKLRFGEGNLHNAEVMLRDLVDSKRINANVKSVPNTATPLKRRRDLVPIDGLSVTIVSQLFWPQLPAEDFKLPDQVESMLATYGHKYHSLKAPRVLQWKPSLGTVSLELTIGNKQVDFMVSPVLATLLLHFQKTPEWTLAELSDTMGMPHEVLRRKVLYWVNRGVLTEKRGAQGALSYHRNENLQTGGPGADDDAEMDVGEEIDQEQQEMAKYEPFLMGMLTNFDTLPLERIHNMLKMFVTDPPYDRTIEQLSSHLGHMVNDGKLILESGVYKKAP